MTASQATRTLDQVQQVIRTMSFAQEMGITIDGAEDGVGKASMPLSDIVSYNGSAFAALAVGAVADVAAGAATLIALPPDVMPFTYGIDTKITAPTTGVRLSAVAELSESVDTKLIFDATVSVHSSDGELSVCGSAVITMNVPRTSIA